MSKIAFTIILVVASIVTIYFWGCKDDTPTNSTSTALTQQEWNQILITDSLISISADTILLGNNTVQNWQNNLNNYKSYSNVENAWVTDNALYVKFMKGGIVLWYKSGSAHFNDFNINREYLKNQKDELIGNNSACLINCLYDDENFSNDRNIIAHLNSRFQSKGFNVTIKNGEEANLNFYGDSLKKYGVIYNDGHGDYFGTPIANWLAKTWIQTGEKKKLRDFSFGGKYFLDWLAGRITIFTVEETHGGIIVVIDYCGVSEIFFDNEYNAGVFPHSFVYFTNCRTRKLSHELAQTLFTKGVAVTIGWDEKNCLTFPEESGMILIDTMLSGGYDLSTAMDLLPPGLRTQNCENYISHLGYSPSSGGTIQLIDTANNIFVGTGGSGIYLSRNNGTSWSAVNNGLPNSARVTALAINHNHIFAGIFGYGIYLSQNNGTSWSAVNNGLPPADSVFYTLGISGNNIFAGTIHRSSGYGVYLSVDNGSSWTAENNGLPTSASISSLAINGNYIFAATQTETTSGVYLSENNGASWSGVNNGFGDTVWVYSLATNGSNIFAGTSGYGVYLSQNNGASWSAVNNGLPVEACIWCGPFGSSMNNMFTDVEPCWWNGPWGVFRSQNNGASWTRVGDFTANAFAVDGNNIFCAGGSISEAGVYLSQNNGGSWTLLNNGLPNTSMNTLAIGSSNLIAGR